jgi:hypothetical protein
MKPYLKKKPITKKGRGGGVGGKAGRMAQGVGPEFISQFWGKKNGNRSK